MKIGEFCIYISLINWPLWRGLLWQLERTFEAVAVVERLVWTVRRDKNKWPLVEVRLYFILAPHDISIVFSE